MDPKTEKRLGKIVALARDGVGGEKTAAIEIVKRICREFDLDFEEVITAGGKVAERVIPYKYKFEEDVAAGVVFRFGATKEHPDVKYNAHRRVMFFEGTVSRYVESLNAMDAYLKVFRRERKRILGDLEGAFIARHGLWTTWEEEERPERPEPTLEQKQAAYRRAQLGEAMLEDVTVRRSIGDGK